MASACEEQRRISVPGLENGSLWLNSCFAGSEEEEEEEEEEGKMMANFGGGFECRQFLHHVHPQHAEPQRRPPPSEPVAARAQSMEDEDYMAVLAERLAFDMLLDEDEEERENAQNHAHAFPWDSVALQGTFQDAVSLKYKAASSPQCPLNGLGTHGVSQVFQATPSATSWDLLEAARLSSLRSGYGVQHDMVQIPGGFVRATVKGAQKSGSVPPHFVWSQNFGGRKQTHASALSRNEPTFSAGNQSCSNMRVGFDECKAPFHAHRQVQQPQQQIKVLSERQGRLFAQAQLARSRCRSTKLGNRFVASGRPGYVNGGESGMRAVFLGKNGPGRESGGTGVFLPRRIDNTHSTKQKPACSTVLLPARIVQALNLNVADLSVKPCGLSDGSQNRRVFLRTGEDPMQTRGGNRFAEDKPLAKYAERAPENFMTHSPSDDITLPHEWTY